MHHSTLFSPSKGPGTSSCCNKQGVTHAFSCLPPAGVLAVNQPETSMQEMNLKLDGANAS